MPRKKQPLSPQEIRMREQALSRAMQAGGLCECHSDSHISHRNNSFYCRRELNNPPKNNPPEYVPGHDVFRTYKIAVVCKQCYDEWRSLHRA